MTKPNPTKLKKTLEPHEVDEHRLHSCEAYVQCLNYAIVLNWKSFSCAQCPQKTKQHKRKSKACP